MSKEKLIYTSQDEYGENFNIHLLEQYKIYVEMADRISQRRMKANSFFITINTSLLTVASVLKDSIGIWVLPAMIIGIIISLVWFYIINSYRQLNSGKFKVVHEFEKKLPALAYKYEWKILGEGKDMRKYWPISHVEKILPLVFAGIYIIGGVLTLIYL
jgi:hypothetical protein